VGKDANLGKHTATDLLLSAAEKFVQDAERPKRDLVSGFTIDK
jgi:hypothetical protein